MIRYALACDNGHDFESWFPSGASYDVQATRGLVACPVCGSAKVEKQLMAPALGRNAAAPSSEAAAPVPATPPDPGPSPMALLSDREQALRAMLRSVREHVTKTADYVGDSFVAEARKMHYGEIEHRSIYGEAKPVDAQALMDEGIEVHAIPLLPDDRH